MISAREFCREREFPVTIFLTYSFDPLFFERIPLSDLRKAEAGAFSLSRMPARFRRPWVNASASSPISAAGMYWRRPYPPAPFILRLLPGSPRQGRVWVGSGNLTYPGWGGHQELGATWSIGPKEDDRGLWLDPLLVAVGAAVRSSVFEDQVEIIRETIGWLKTPANVTHASPILFGTPDRPLAPHLPTVGKIDGSMSSGSVPDRRIRMELSYCGRTRPSA